MPTPRLIQIPFSSNCVKVRRALELKGVPFETLDIRPMDRKPVLAASGQALVPVLQHGDRAIADSTAILAYVEEAFPEPALLPRDAAERAACWVLEDWADVAFMALTRRVAYWTVVNTPNAIETLFFPGASGLRRAIMGRIARRAVCKRFRISAGRHRRDAQEIRRLCALATERLGGRSYLFDHGVTVADVTLASMIAPLLAASGEIRADPAVASGLAWSETVLGSPITDLYRPLRVLADAAAHAA